MGLAVLGHNRALQIERKYKAIVRNLNKTIKRQERDIENLTTMIGENEKRHAKDMTDIKNVLIEVNEKLETINELYLETQARLRIREHVEEDMEKIVEVFLEKFPEVKLSDIVREKNKKYA